MSDRYRAYILDISYFSGKLEAYLRYKQIPFERIEATWRHINGQLLPHTGIARVPLLQTPGGVWLQDTTPMIDWLERRHPDPPIVPEDPLQDFASRLLEDYADEWMWRPALHYRWSHPEDARHLSMRIALEEFHDVSVPAWAVAAFIRRRQRRVYVKGDGVDETTRAHVEETYLRTLDGLERLLSEQRFLLGDRPSLADFGFFASMFRHFSLDPTPARIMRQRAPGVFAWVARLWNARADRTPGEWPAPGTLPGVWSELVADAGRSYLPYLHANARAWQEGRSRLDFEVEGVHYRGTPVVRYRVWCRERLQDAFEALPEDARPRVRRWLEDCGAWEPLWRDGRIRSDLHPAGADPAVCRPPQTAADRARRLRDPWNPVPR